MSVRTPALTYLACAFTHSNPAVREARFHAANKAAAALMRCGHIVFSPISHGFAIALDGALPTDWRFWQTHCEAYLRASRELIVLRVDGWDVSVGVAAEMAIARELGIPVSYIDPDAADRAA